MSSPLILFTLMSLLNHAHYFRLKHRHSHFIGRTNGDTNSNDRCLRLIAAHHVLSKLCFQLQARALHRRRKAINNLSVYHRMPALLDAQFARDHSSDARQVYREGVRGRVEQHKTWHKAVFWMYALAVNVSLLRVLFASDGLDLVRDHPRLLGALCVKVACEVVCCAALWLWCACDGRVGEIARNELGARFYFIALRAPDLAAIQGLLCEWLLAECDRFYQAGCQGRSARLCSYATSRRVRARQINIPNVRACTSNIKTIHIIHFRNTLSHA